MLLTALVAMVRKDLLMFLTDRRAVLMGFVAPIAIASFFGSIFSGDTTGRVRINVAIVDQDQSEISKAIVSAANADSNFQLTVPTSDQTREAVRKGQVTVGIVIPAGFGAASATAFFGGAARPELTMWFDPSRSTELGLVRGIMTQHVMEAVSAEVFTGSSGARAVDDTLKGLEGSAMPPAQREKLRPLLEAARSFYQSQDTSPQGDAAASRPTRGLSVPYTVHEEAVTSGDDVAYNGYAHSFAGMGIQFLLFSSIDLGIGILLERQRGLWKRLRSAPISRFMLLAGKALSGAVIALMTLLVSFGFAMLVFKVQITGSVLGFLMVATACALMASMFGILIASLGRTPGGSRGIASLSVLMMVMLGGAWVPTFLFPLWLQRLTVAVPARWAVDGLDAMTWRGLPLSSAVAPTLALLAFAMLFAAIALARFRWEEA